MSTAHTPSPNSQFPIFNSIFVRLRVLQVFVVTSALAGCSSNIDYNAIANRLRQQTIDQQQQIDALQAQLQNKNATIRNLQQHFADNNPPLPTLPPERLAELFTANRLELRSQTDVADLEGGKKGLRVFIRTYAADGQIVPAAGTLTIEAFELPPTPGPATAPAEPRRLGTWTFTPQDLKKNWFTGLGQNHIALSCPWTTPPSPPPTQPAIIIRARLQDALTGLTLETQLDKKLAP